MEATLKNYTALKGKYPNAIIWFNDKNTETVLALSDSAVATCEQLNLEGSREQHPEAFSVQFNQSDMDTYLKRMIKAGYQVGVMEKPIDRNYRIKPSDFK